MKLRCSLFKRTLVPLLAAIAAIPFCAPTHAASAILTSYGSAGPGSGRINETVQCTVESAGSTWYQAVFHAQQLADNGVNGYSPTIYVNYAGPGTSSAYGYITYLPSGTYNCWCICSGYGPNYRPWSVSTGGGGPFINLQ